MLVLRYKHIPRYRITEELKYQILAKGLIHFTYYDNATHIQKEGIVPQKKKAMFKCEKIWFGCI